MHNISTIFFINNGDTEALYYAKSIGQSFKGEKQVTFPVYNFAPIDIPILAIQCFDDKISEQFAAEFKRIGVDAIAIPTNGKPKTVRVISKGDVPPGADHWLHIYIPSRSPPVVD